PPWPGGPRHPADHHTLGEHEMTAEVAGRGRDREARRAEGAGRAAVTGQPAPQRGTLQPKRNRVEETVEEADTAVLVVADGPVGEPCQCGGAGGDDARLAEDARGGDPALEGPAAGRGVQRPRPRPYPAAAAHERRGDWV